MNGPVKLGRKKQAGAPTTKPRPSSRNPFKELHSSSLPPAHSREAPKRGCFGFLLSGSSSTSSTTTTTSSSSSSIASSSRGLLPRSKSLPRTPRSAPPNSTTLRPLGRHGDPAEVRSGAPRKNPSSRPSFEKLQQSRSDKHKKPMSPPLVLRWRNRERADAGASLQKSAEARSRGEAMGRPTAPALEVDLEGDGYLSKKQGPCLEVTPERGALPALPPEVCVGLDLDKGGTPPGKLSPWCISDATPGQEGEQQQRQRSQTPTSTRTGTPPVQASISPELGAQSVLPTPACFAAGHLLAGVQDRRKCRPRGILNVGGCGLEISGGRGLGSFGAPGNGTRASLTQPSPVEASVRWLSSPCNGGSGRLSTVSSSNSKVSFGVCPAEASMNWFLSPLENVADACFLEGVPSGSYNLASGTTPLSERGLWSVSPAALAEISLNSSNFDSTPSTVEICCSPTTNSSVSPFSMIIQKAAASSRCKDHSQQDKGVYRYESSVNNSPCLGDPYGNRNVICAPSSCSSSNGPARPHTTVDLHTRAQAASSLRFSSSPSQVLASDSKSARLLSDPSFQFGCPLMPLNSVDLACFQRPLCRPSSINEELQTRGENFPSSEMRISWREGLISRIFDMDEFDHNIWSSDKEDGDCHREDQLSFNLDTKFEWNFESSMSKEVNEKDTTDGFGSFEFVGFKQNEEQCKVHGSSCPISCAESLSMEVDRLLASDDSDWNLFFKNHLFEYYKNHIISMEEDEKILELRRVISWDDDLNDIYYDSGKLQGFAGECVWISF